MTVGLLDYYRQFEGLSEQEVNRELRERAHERRRRELERPAPLELSSSTWPELPHPYVVGAVTYLARRGLHRYPSASSDELRSELAHRHELDPERIAIGNGAAQLLASASAALLEPGQELITPWPSYWLFPLMARRVGGRAVPVNALDADAVLAAVTPRTRVVTIARPNDPTGELLELAQLRRLLAELPEQVALLLDEALVEFIDAEPVDGALGLLESHPRMIVFRSFSKAWGLAGLRCGYAIGGPGAQELLRSLEPDLGVGELAQAGALESLRSCSAAVAARARALAGERRRLSAELRELGFAPVASQANVLWLRHPALGGSELADGLARAGVIVAAGAPLGDAAHVRIQVRGEAASQRLLAALAAIVEH